MFAIIAKVDGISNTGRSIVEAFLKQQLNKEQVEKYLVIFDEFWCIVRTFVVCLCLGMLVAGQWIPS